jgi:uncharacterized membrane protein YphA (DoxX/SURF4 family)
MRYMNYVLPLHSILRWAVLLLGFWVIISAVTGLLHKRNYTNTDNKANLFFMISCDIQLLAGLLLYFSSWFEYVKDNTAEVMKNASLRFFAIEHFIMMLIAWLLVHIGRSMVKRSDNDRQKHKRGLIYFGIAMLLILAMIPWPFRQAGIARQLFPQF